MKVLLTGASGFIGSHVLDVLRTRAIPTAVLLRPTSNRRFLESHLPYVETRFGTIADPASLRAALAGISHVIHAAGLTKAVRAAELHRVNAGGTENLVAAINSSGGTVQRLVHLSTLAAGRPATSGNPARESDPPAPVSEYGRSKRAAERAVAGECRAEFVILRPPGVFGPRDREWLCLVRAVQRGLAPQFGPRPQELSLVFAPDLAEVMVAALTAPGVCGQTLNVASPTPVTSSELCRVIAGELGAKARTLRLPLWVLRLACVTQEQWSLLTGRASILSHGKYLELAAPGWVCDTARLRETLGLTCPTPLRAGLQTTIAWYREHGWL
jgi:nucleoside-diphosphate-sugar epimerase